MSKALIDKFSEEELRQLVKSSTSFYELSLKLGYSCKGNNNITIRNRLEKYDISTDHFTGTGKSQIKRTPENTFIKDSTAVQSVLRRMYYNGNYTDYKCSICGQEPFWNGRELTLTLDHINGNNHDDRLENLRWVCPNCDRQLSTFAGKNSNKKDKYNSREQNYCLDCGKPISYEALRCEECAKIASRKIKRPEKEELYNILIENKGNFTLVGKLFNVSDNAIRKWCDSYNLPRHSSDYKIK